MKAKLAKERPTFKGLNITVVGDPRGGVAASWAKAPVVAAQLGER